MSEILNQSLLETSFAQKQRLAYIDFTLYFTGMMTRSEIVQHFELGLAAATRDINLYKSLKPHNMRYDNAVKKYFIAPDFTPLFAHDAHKTLIKLAHQISDGSDAIGEVEFPVEKPSNLNTPNIDVIATLSQAMVQHKVVSVIYTSLSSGSGARELVPHSIVDNGQRWHVRAFDRKSQSFRDFVLTRLSQVSIIDDETVYAEEQAADEQWQTLLPLTLIPHRKNISHPTAIELDFGMTDGKLIVHVRKAMAGYLLRRWNVDCSPHASLKGAEYQLQLANLEVLDEADNRTIAPGYHLHS